MAATMRWLPLAVPLSIAAVVAGIGVGDTYLGTGPGRIIITSFDLVLLPPGTQPAVHDCEGMLVLALTRPGVDVGGYPGVHPVVDPARWSATIHLVTAHEPASLGCWDVAESGRLERTSDGGWTADLGEGCDFAVWRIGPPGRAAPFSYRLGSCNGFRNNMTGLIDL